MEIYEYVHSIGNRMFPAYEIEEDGKEYQVDTACTIDFIVPHRDGQLDMSKFPFTKKQFLENTSVIRSLQALGINIEKFWVALLFVYYLTQKKTENVMAIPAPAFDQFRAFAKYLHANPDAKIRIWRGREPGNHRITRGNTDVGGYFGRKFCHTLCQSVTQCGVWFGRFLDQFERLLQNYLCCCVSATISGAIQGRG